MKKPSFKPLAAILASTLLIVTTEGCGRSQTATSPMNVPYDSRLDTSKYVELDITTMCVPGANFDAVLRKLNEKLRTDLNCTVKITVMSFAEARHKYPIAIASGQKVDMIWGSSFWNCLIYAAQGAFLDIGDMIITYTPGLYRFYSEDLWNATKINGKIYCVPCCGPVTRYSTYGFLYREDLRKKYHLPEVKDLKSIESYLKGIKSNMGITPVVDNGGLLSMFHIYHDINNIYNGFGAETYAYGIGAKYDDKTRLFNVWATPEFASACELMKRWADAGFWSRSVLFGKEDISSSLISGNSVASFHCGSNMAFTEVIYPTSVSHPDWEWKYLNFAQISGKALVQSPLGMFFSLPKSSPNPERVLAVLEKITVDEGYYKLVAYGIEGTDYKSDAAGNYVRMGSGYGKNGLGTFPENPAIGLTNPGETMANEFNATLKQYDVQDFATRFVEDTSSFSIERNNMTQVFNQYCKPLMVGAAPGDVKTNITILLAKAREAGQEKLLEALQAQWTQYCEANGIR